MHAAVVNSFADPPRYEEVSEPCAVNGEVVVDVLAAGLHPRVRSAADGTHYESTGHLPLTPGIDGVGRTAAGELVYFVLPDTRNGSMADRVAVDLRRCAPLPSDVDPATIAAVMNPAMSSWVALRRRIAFQAGQHVLILGATGSAGGLAVQIARHLGAAEVIAAGRNRDRLTELEGEGADRVVVLGEDPGELGTAAADVDVVLDYLWGTAAESAIETILHSRPDRGRLLTWVEIGSMAGLEVAVASRWLRAARLQIVGSGQGSVSTRNIVAELTDLAAHLSSERYAIDVERIALEDVERAWERTSGSSRRTVFVPAAARP